MAVSTEALRRLLKGTYDTLGFEPYPEQWEVLLCQAREIIMAGGEQASKSTTASKYLMGRYDMGYDGENPLLFWIAGKDYESTLKEMEYCAIDAQKLNIDLSLPHRFYPDNLEIILGQDGTEIARIKNKSLKDEMKIMAEAPNGIIIAEAAQITFSAFRKLQARVARTRGWIFAEGTFEGSTGWYPELWAYYQTPGTDGKSFSLPSWVNRSFYPRGRQDPEILRQEAKYPADFFNERFAAIPAKPEGVVISEFQNRIHVGDYEFDKNLPVDLACDPGYMPSACVVLAIQKQGDQIVVIDEVYLHGRVLEDVIEACKRRMWWQNRAEGVIDIAGRAHMPSASPVEVWQKAGMSMKSRRVDQKGGIILLRTLMKPHSVTNKPAILIDQKCLGLICECGGGKPPDLTGVQEETHNSVELWGTWIADRLTGKPQDKHNHASKALIYYLANKVGYREIGGFKSKVKVRDYV